MILISPLMNSKNFHNIFPPKFDPIFEVQARPQVFPFLHCINCSSSSAKSFLPASFQASKQAISSHSQLSTTLQLDVIRDTFSSLEIFFLYGFFNAGVELGCKATSLLIVRLCLFSNSTRMG